MKAAPSGIGHHWLHHDGVRYLEGTIDWATDAIAVTLAEGSAAVGLDVCFRTELERIQSLRRRNLGDRTATRWSDTVGALRSPGVAVAVASGFDDVSLL